jgi:colanic acid/amylovoran biosynthesis glycosyltransferase
LESFKFLVAFSKYLQEHNCTSANTVFYSYWFHKSAILLSILKDKEAISKFASRAHSVDLYHNNWGIVNEKVKVPSFKMFKFKHTALLLPISNHGHKFLKDKYSSILPNIKLSYLGVGVPAQKPQTYDADNFHIVTCSGIDFNKRIHKLAEALCQIKKPVKWTHFGAGSMLDEVQKFIQQMPSNITVDLRGNTSNKIIQEFYSSTKVDLFVNLSIVEGLPVSIMEALSYKIPVLATSVNGTPEAVIDGENGFLLDVDFSIDELVSKIKDCINNPELINRMREKSYSIYREKFNAEVNYTAFASDLLNL